MPRPKPARTIDSEANLAQRITFERTARGWSYTDVARALTEAGCKIDKSQVLRIEKGNPRRRVTVDELVAFARVFGYGEDVGELLVPMDMINDRHAKQLADLWQEHKRAIGNAGGQAIELVTETMIAGYANPDLVEYLVNRNGEQEPEDQVDTDDEPGLDVLLSGVLAFWDTIMEAALIRAQARIDDPDELRRLEAWRDAFVVNSEDERRER